MTLLISDREGRIMFVIIAIIGSFFTSTTLAPW